MSGGSIPPVRGLVALVSGVIALVRCLIAVIRHVVATIGRRVALPCRWGSGPPHGLAPSSALTQTVKVVNHGRAFRLELMTLIVGESTDT